jgi:hypothetical protein
MVHILNLADELAIILKQVARASYFDLAVCGLTCRQLLQAARQLHARYTNRRRRIGNAVLVCSPGRGLELRLTLSARVQCLDNYQTEISIDFEMPTNALELFLCPSIHFRQPRAYQAKRARIQVNASIVDLGRMQYTLVRTGNDTRYTRLWASPQTVVVFDRINRANFSSNIHCQRWDGQGNLTTAYPPQSPYSMAISLLHFVGRVNKLGTNGLHLSLKRRNS